jgi:hypothetical protein
MVAPAVHSSGASGDARLFSVSTLLRMQTSIELTSKTDRERKSLDY